MKAILLRNFIFLNETMTMCIVFLLLSSAVSSAINPSDTIPVSHAVRAAQFCQSQEIDLALSEINSAILEENESGLAYTWYVRGFVYKEIYKRKESDIHTSQSRDIAVESFLKAKGMTAESQGGLNYDAPLKYLIKTYLHDALDELNASDPMDDALALVLWGKFQDYSLKSENAELLNEKLNEWKKAHTLFQYKKWLANPCDMMQADLASNDLKDWLNIDPKDCTSRYNLAVLYYKIAEMSQEMKEDCKIDRNFEGQIESALSNLKEAEKLCPDDSEIVKGLLNVYRLMNDTVQIERYEKRSSELLNSKQSPKSN